MSSGRGKDTPISSHKCSISDPLLLLTPLPLPTLLLLLLLPLLPTAEATFTTLPHCSHTLSRKRKNRVMMMMSINRYIIGKGQRGIYNREHQGGNI